MTKTAFTITVFCDGAGCTKTWEFKQRPVAPGVKLAEYPDGIRGWLQDDLDAVYIVDDAEGRGHSNSAGGSIADAEYRVKEQWRVKYNLQHCDVDLKATPQRVWLILDRLVDVGRTRVSLREMELINSTPGL